MKTRRSFKGSWQFFTAAALVGAALSLTAPRPYAAAAGQTGGAAGAAAPPKQPPQGVASAAKQLKIDLGKSIKVSLPAETRELKPANFRTPDGKTGWVVRIPGGLPLATPAYANGRVFVGGGYGSNEFYAFDARTGRLVWKTQTGDDGPTAAVVEGNRVAFNTESCTLVVVSAQTGKVLWQEWLGDPLMSQPAVSKGRLYMAYPSGGGGGEDSSPHKHALPPSKKKVQQQDSEEEQQASHRLLCADLRTGRHLWERAISSDVISAPVVADGKVYATTFDGTSYSFDAVTGKLIWKKENAGTSAPLIVAGEVVVTQKEESDGKAYESVQRLDARRGVAMTQSPLARSEAGYLGKDKGGGVAIKKEAQASLDSSVGFGSAPEDAQLNKANEHLGVKTVVGGWAYQGSRAAYSKGRMLNAQGRYLNSVGVDDGRSDWRAEVTGGGHSADEQVFSPPALGEDFLYLSSSLGHLLSVGQKDGRIGFMYHFGEPMVFQPALAGGNVYVGTSNGLLICLKTGSLDADGWYAWGGNGEHNKNK
ncbi:MAG: PQQ-binding-like beta-propeller repeat protein [Pyrinomonadaceae bacterium]